MPQQPRSAARGSLVGVTDTAITYLDHAASAPMRPEAIEAMMPFLAGFYANPSGSHRFARRARQAIDEARDVVAEVVGCRPGEVVFTGCGTESDNMAITGAVSRHGGIAVCPAAEHHAVLDVVEHLGGVVVGVDEFGSVDLEELARRPRRPTRRVDRQRDGGQQRGRHDHRHRRGLEDRASPRPSALLHTDAVQAACWLDLREVTPHVDLMSLSAHKFGGPKGVGILIERGGPKVDALIMGGGQERERRSGTQNTAGIVATAVALRLTDVDRDAEAIRLAELRDRLVKELQSQLDGVIETVPPRSQGGRLGPRVHPRRRVRGAAVPARRGRRLRVGGVGLCERRDGAVARARRDGCRPYRRARCAAAVARPHHDRGRHRPCDRGHRRLPSSGCRR